MSTGTGLLLLGVWITVAAAWHSRVVPGFSAILLTAMAVALTIYLK